MKTLSTIALLACMTAFASAQMWFSSPSTAVSTNVAYAVAPTGSKVTLLSGYGEITPTLQIYRTTAYTMIASNYTAGVSNVAVSDHTIFGAADVALLYSVSGNAYQRVLLNTTNTIGLAGGILLTNELTAATTSRAYVAGDVVYKLTLAGACPLSTAAPTTLSSSGSGIVWYADGGPTLFQVKDLGTPTTNQFCIVSGVR